MSENKKVKEAKSKVDEFMSEDEARELAELREKWQLDYDSSISYATKRGYEEGHTAGHAEGHAEGLAEGENYNIPYNIPIYVDTIKEGYPILCA